jgi:hypothetical protein
VVFINYVWKFLRPFSHVELVLYFICCSLMIFSFGIRQGILRVVMTFHVICLSLNLLRCIPWYWSHRPMAEDGIFFGSASAP